MATKKRTRRIREKRIGLKVFEDDKAAFQQKADEAGLSLSSWMVTTLKQHAKPTQVAPVKS